MPGPTSLLSTLLATPNAFKGVVTLSLCRYEKVSEAVSVNNRNVESRKSEEESACCVRKWVDVVFKSLEVIKDEVMEDTADIVGSD